MTASNARDQAPGQLELVRRFLNTWEMSHATDAPRDLLPALIRDRRRYQRTFGVPPPRTAAERDELLALRDDLRDALGAAAPDERVLNAWLGRRPLSPRLVDSKIEHVPLQSGLTGTLLAAVVDAVAVREWPRLKACPDCEYVFFDHTRNGSRRWCMMARGDDPDGRSCGAIAKVRNYRARQAARLTK
jgi:predicted RNA-binding Zn ribbon-like protein